MANQARSPATASPHASVVFPAPPFRLISATVNMATKPIILDGLANQTGYIAILDVLIDGLADSPLPEPITALATPNGSPSHSLLLRRMRDIESDMG